MGCIAVGGSSSGSSRIQLAEQRGGWARTAAPRRRGYTRRGMACSALTVSVVPDATSSPKPPLPPTSLPTLDAPQVRSSRPAREMTMDDVERSLVKQQGLLGTFQERVARAAAQVGGAPTRGSLGAGGATEGYWRCCISCNNPWGASFRAPWTGVPTRGSLWVGGTQKSWRCVGYGHPEKLPKNTLLQELDGLEVAGVRKGGLHGLLGTSCGLGMHWVHAVVCSFSAWPLLVPMLTGGVTRRMLSCTNRSTARSHSWRRCGSSWRRTCGTRCGAGWHVCVHVFVFSKNGACDVWV